MIITLVTSALQICTAELLDLAQIILSNVLEDRNDFMPNDDIMKTYDGTLNLILDRELSASSSGRFIHNELVLTT